MPLRGIIGTDLLSVRPDWAVIDNPLAEKGRRDPIVILPAIRPDVALFHALKADVHGNVWIGVQRELITMAHASKTTLVTVERIEKTDFLRDPVLAAGTIPGLYVTAIAEAPNGAWPVGLDNAYPPDAEALAAYANAAATPEGFARWARRLDAAVPRNLQRALVVRQPTYPPPRRRNVRDTPQTVALSIARDSDGIASPRSRGKETWA
jgi:glutaconate CoA-transferase subunit A